jgi:beta-phosphoglucomutase
MKNIKAVLFDFDGVIADTMGDNYQAWKRAFADHDIEVAEDEYMPLEGCSTMEIARIILSKSKNSTSPSVLSKLKHHYYKKHNNFKIYSSVVEILDALIDKDILLALVTGSDRKRLNESIPELLNKFQTIVAGGEAEKGKPFPDPYLLAVERLALKPQDCLVVENAPLGITSAKRAGCHCLALTTTVDEKTLSEADEVLDSHKSLLERLSSFI